MNFEILHDKLPVERVLGTRWCIESDTYCFRIILNDQPLTRRGILSTISSIYDPLGLIAPVIMRGKQPLQQMCKDHIDWDDPLPEEIVSSWESWRKELPLLEVLQVERCYKPKDVGVIKTVELHHFSDGSCSGYSECSYIRMVGENDRTHCSLLMGKSRVTPIRPVTIPRIELTAAVVAVRVSKLLNKELQIENVQNYYWTDSRVVLGYIANERRRFQMFVANRISQIREFTSPLQWNYVSTDINPADIASRGVSAKDFLENSSWIKGPKFLWNLDVQLSEPLSTDSFPVDFSDPEVKQAKCLSASLTETRHTFELERFEHISSWNRLKKAVSLCLKLKQKLFGRGGVDEKSSIQQSVTVLDLQEAEKAVLKQVHSKAFGDERRMFCESSNSKDQTVRRNSPLKKLSPFMDENHLLRVGGRLNQSSLSAEVKHPVLLPRKGRVTELIIKHHHEKTAHQGRGMTLNELRGSGFWIVGGSSAVSKHVFQCVTCRKLRSRPQTQKMCDLPRDRTEPAPPFSECGVDFFGPFFVREGRKVAKRYCVLFTCLACRAIHIETTCSMSSDSFINALRRFTSLRGPVRMIRSDQGTNLVGARNELKQALQEMNEEDVKDFLLKQNCDFVEFRFNVPTSSHMGGVWERQIRSVRSVLCELMDN